MQNAQHHVCANTWQYCVIVFRHIPKLYILIKGSVRAQVKRLVTNDQRDSHCCVLIVIARIANTYYK